MQSHHHHHHHHHPKPCHDHPEGHQPGAHHTDAHHPVHGSFVEANKNYFDTHADQAEARSRSPMYEKMAQEIAKAMLETHKFDEAVTTVMDYACGPGLMSSQLAPYTKSVVGVDISQGVVDVYNRRVSDQGISPDEMKAVCVELQGVPGELDNAKFDVIICSMSYHHFPSINDTTRILAYFLKPGGVLLVSDMLRPDSKDGEKPSLFPEEYHHIVPHTDVFEEADMRKAYDFAGLSQFEFIPDVTSSTFHTKVFLAKGTKV